MTTNLIDLQPHLDRKREREALRRQLEGTTAPVDDLAKHFVDRIEEEAMRRLKTAIIAAAALKKANSQVAPPNVSPPASDHFYGSKYNADMTIPEIIKRLRADILAAKRRKGCPFHGARISVRKESVTHSWALRIKIRTFPENPINPAYVKLLGPRRDYNNLHDLHPADRPGKYTARAQEALETLRGLAQAYNHDRSDTMTDYFDVRFYLDVDFDYKLEDNAEEELRKEIFPHE